ncbi:MAG: hypothetical protein IJ877_05110 [Candidatus Gastranaerophilales bacterium]|nr:hypothetical protein [Candidatus Gastranaerophilales bacterium]
MNITSISAFNPISYKGNNNNNANKRRATAALLALLATQPLAMDTYAASNTRENTSYTATASATAVDPRIPLYSDFYYAYLKYGDKYEIQPHYDSRKNGVGSYYQYGNQAFDKEGKAIRNPEKLYGFKPVDGASSTQEDKLDPRIPLYSDFYYAYLKYGDKYEIQPHYDSRKNGVGSYYQYGNQAFDKEGKAISNPEKLYGFKPLDGETTQKQDKLDPRIPLYSDFYYAYLRYGTQYEIQPKYDVSGDVGAYYQYGNQAFDKEGKRINNPEKLYGFETQNNDSTSTTTKIDPRIPLYSDFYYAYLRYGDRYEIQPHYDARPNGIGSYYQYGNQAFDKEGKTISNPEKLYGFDKDVK